MKLTRREWAGALAASGAASAVQAPANAAQDAPEDLDKAATARLQRNAAALAQAKLPMAVEPAFSFKAR